MTLQSNISIYRPGSEKGSTVVEFALSFALIFAFFSGIFQYGYAFYAYNALVNAVRDGGRYAANLPYSSTTATPDDAYRNKVRNMVVYGSPTPAASAKPILADLTTSNVAVTMTAGNPGTMTPPTAVTVSITGFTVNAIFRNITMNGVPYCIFPYTGILTPPAN